MSFDLPALTRAVARHGAVVRVLVLRAAGSVPREAGVSMLVMAAGEEGTIGGGTLEWEAMRTARGMLAGGPAQIMRVLPLGPALGQCCGGSVTLVWERFDADTLPATLPHARPLGPEPRPVPVGLGTRLRDWQPGQRMAEVDGWLIEGPPAVARPLWVWGAGHVGRALVSVMAPFPDRAITWADVAADRFPQAPPGVTILPATDLPRLARHAPQGADHLIVTLSHETDLALCHALLARGFASCGLIGSATKWARFRSRLHNLGHPAEAVARIACPIGDPALGKHPQAIAVSVAAVLLGGRMTTCNGVDALG